MFCDGELHYGVVYFPEDEQKKFNAKLFKEKDEIKLELLDVSKDLGFRCEYLLGEFDISHDKAYITFLECYKQEFKDKPEIEFKDLITYMDFREKPKKEFIFLDTKRNFVCFTIAHLDKWIYPSLNMLKDYQLEFLNNKREKVKKKDAEYLLLKMFKGQYDFSFMVQNEKIKLSIISEFEIYPTCYPKIELEPNIYIKIQTEKPIEVRFLNKIIRMTNDLFTLFFAEQAIITKMYEGEDFKYYIDYFGEEYKLVEDEYHSIFSNIKFEDIKNNFSSILQAWFDKYDKYRFIIHSVCNAEHPRYIEDSFTRQVQLVETYGNVLSKGVNTRKDISTAIKCLEDDLFKKIFYLKYHIPIIHIIDDRCFFDPNIDLNTYDYKDELAGQIMSIRNHFIHPYRNGKFKNSQDDNISEIFAPNGNLHFHKIGTLSKSLSKLLEGLLFQELGIEQYYNHHIY